MTYFSSQNIELYDHQRLALEKIRNGCILVGGVGTGKSLTAIAYAFSKIRKGRHPLVGDNSYFRGSNDTDVYVITTARKRHSVDWHRDSSKLYFLPHVDSWNNIQKYTEVKNAFFIFDEQRLVGSGAWVKAFYKIARNNKWILLTATPGDTWMEYIPVMVANGYYKNKTEFIKRHVVYSRWSKFPKVERYLDVQRLIDIRNKIVVNMEFTRRTKRHNVMVKLNHDKGLTKQLMVDRWNIYDGVPIRNVSELVYLLRKVTNSDKSRFKKLKEVFDKHKKVIVFYNFNYELELLELFCKENKIKYTQWNGHKHEDLLRKEDEWIYLCQYTSAAEAWNAIETDTIVFFSQHYSYKILEQATGRIERLTTPFTDLYYYHFLSNAPIDLSIRKALNAKRVFNESRFQDY